MYKFIVNCWCVMAATAAVSCSVGEDEIGLLGDNINSSYSSSSPTDISNVLSRFAGNYTGVWWLNEVKTDADAIKKDSSPSYLRFRVDQARHSLGLDLYEFPFKALTKLLFPDQGMAYFTVDFQYSTPLMMIGYSEKAVYFNLQSEGSAYVQIPYEVTTKEGDSFSIVLDMVPDKSTVNLDIVSGTLSCNFVIRQIEIYDKDQQKRDMSLDKEIKVTFISTQKIG